MPLYEYRCTECGEEFEKQMRFSEADQLPPCPNCRSIRTQKKISRVVSFFPLSASAAGASSAPGCGSSSGFT